MAFKMKGFSPFTHGADKDTEHGEHHRDSLEKIKHKKRKKKLNKAFGFKFGDFV